MNGEFVALEDRNPGHAICKYAERINAAFIVTGTSCVFYYLSSINSSIILSGVYWE